MAIGGSLAKNITKNAAETAAKSALKNTSKSAAKELLEGVSKRMLQDTAKSTIKTATKEAAEAGIKKAGKEALEATGKTVVKESAQEAAEATGKKVLKESGEEVVEATGKKVVKEGGMTTAKKIALAGGAVVGAGYVGQSLLEYSQKNNKKFDITSIVDASDMYNSLKPSAILTFAQPQEISKKDRVELSETDCEPPLNGLFNIVEVINDTSIKIQIPEKLTKNGTKGNMILKTTFENQLLDNVGGSIKSVGSTVGSAVGEITSATIGASGDIIGKTIGGIAEGLGISFENIRFYGIIILIVLLVLSLSSIALKFA